MLWLGTNYSSLVFRFPAPNIEYDKNTIRNTNMPWDKESFENFTFKDCQKGFSASTKH